MKLNPKYLNDSWISGENKDYNRRKPFPHGILTDFLLSPKGLREALLNQEFSQKRSDLFHFLQTSDLTISQDPIIEKVYKMLSSKEFLGFLGNITRKKLRSVSMFGSIYNDTHHLLCHDDRLEDRKVAYILYLSDMDEGGALELFRSKKGIPLKVETSIQPAFNSFAFFTVSKESFHQVEEVTKGQRLSLTGWFHG